LLAFFRAECQEERYFFLLLLLFKRGLKALLTRPAAICGMKLLVVGYLNEKERDGQRSRVFVRKNADIKDFKITYCLSVCYRGRLT